MKKRERYFVSIVDLLEDNSLSKETGTELSATSPWQALERFQEKKGVAPMAYIYSVTAVRKQVYDWLTQSMGGVPNMGGAVPIEAKGFVTLYLPLYVVTQLELPIPTAG